MMSTEKRMALPRRAARLPDWVLFLKKFFEQGTSIGSVVPSSPFYAEALARDIDTKSARCIVELGAGTGAVTRALLERAGRDCRCLFIERDGDFCRRLRDHFPHAEIIERDACALDDILRERGIDHIDHIVCGLALTCFAPENRHRVLDACRRHLNPTGTFRQLTFVPWVHHAIYERYFDDVCYRWVMRNLPPAGFYLCGKPKIANGPEHMSPRRTELSR